MLKRLLDHFLGNVPKRHVFFSTGSFRFFDRSVSLIRWKLFASSLKSPNPFSTEILLLDPYCYHQDRSDISPAQALPEWAGGELLCLGALPWKYLGDITFWHRSGPPATRTRSVGAYITPMSRTGLWYANNELVTGANLNQLTSLGGLTL